MFASPAEVPQDEGWQDSPARVVETAPEPQTAAPDAPVKRKPGRPRKVTTDATNNEEPTE